MKTLIYLAGPYTGDREANVARALRVADDLIARGYAVLVPHLSHYQKGWGHSMFWYGYDLEFLRRCDMIYMMEGWPRSFGSRLELRKAQEWGIPRIFQGAPGDPLLEDVETAIHDPRRRI